MPMIRHVTPNETLRVLGDIRRGKAHYEDLTQFVDGDSGVDVLFDPYRISRSDEGLLLVDETDRVLGMAILTKNGESCDVHAVYVFPEYRGQGYGYQLLATAIARIRETGFAGKIAALVNDDSRRPIERLPADVREGLLVRDS